LGNFYTQPVFSTHAVGDPVRILWKWWLLVKLEWLGYRMVRKLWRYVKPFHLIAERHGQTERTAISISCVDVLSRDKNVEKTDRQTDIRTYIAIVVI